MDKKKKIIICVIAAFLVAGIGLGTIYIVGKANENKSEITETATVTDAETSDTTEKMTEGELEREENITEVVASDKPQATTQAQGMMQADKPETTEQGGTTQQTVADKPDEPTDEQPKPQTPETQPQTPETTEAPAQPQTPPATTTEQTTTEQATAEPVAVWVVDQPAWDEEVPIYEQRCRMVCASCGGYMYSVEDIEAHPCVSSRYDDFYDVQVGTETIHHDEIGHWEYQ